MVFYGLDDYGIRLHTRNVFQVLGETLSIPSQVVLTSAPVSRTGKVTGGTATAVSIAHAMHVPVINLVNENGFEQAEALLTQLKQVSDDWEGTVRIDRSTKQLQVL